MGRKILMDGKRGRGGMNGGRDGEGVVTEGWKRDTYKLNHY